MVMNRPISLLLLVLVMLAIFTAVADGPQAKLATPPSLESRNRELPREWVWRRKTVSFEGMIRTPRAD